jgi:spore germination protein KB
LLGLLLIWSILVQTGALAYCGLKAFKQTVGIKKEKPYLILLFGLLMAVLTYYIAQNRVFFQDFREHQWLYISLPFQFILPVVLLIVLLVKKIFTKNTSK